MCLTGKIHPRHLCLHDFSFQVDLDREVAVAVAVAVVEGILEEAGDPRHMPLTVVTEGAPLRTEDAAGIFMIGQTTDVQTVTKCVCSAFNCVCVAMRILADVGVFAGVKCTAYKYTPYCQRNTPPPSVYSYISLHVIHIPEPCSACVSKMATVLRSLSSHHCLLTPTHPPCLPMFCLFSPLHNIHQPSYATHSTTKLTSLPPSYIHPLTPPYPTLSPLCLFVCLMYTIMHAIFVLIW